MIDIIVLTFRDCHFNTYRLPDERLGAVPVLIDAVRGTNSAEGQCAGFGREAAFLFDQR